MSEVIIRNVKLEDLRQVSEITIRGWQTAYRRIIDDNHLDNLSIDTNYQKRLKDYKENGFIVAEKSSEIVGFCRYRVGNEYIQSFPDINIDCEICALYVKYEFKRTGIGKKLVNYVKEAFRKAGFTKMIIWCLKENYPSRAFYEKMGGSYCGENIIKIGNKEYKEAGFIYDLNKTEELELVFPTEEYKVQVEEYLQEFIDNDEYEIAGDGGLDRIKDFDEWLKKVENDLSLDTVENNRIPATVYLTIRKSDKKIVGNLQIRHRLNEKLLAYGGHIGDSVRPSERRKGYATEQIRLALQKCKELGIGNVLMDCDKTNIGSAKSIINNEGVLENEAYIDNELVQKYWISLKKKFVTNPNKMSIVRNGNTIIKNFNDKYFSGDIALIKFDVMTEPYVIKDTNLYMANNGYRWLEFYSYDKKIRLTAMYNERNEIVEWYFDIAKRIGKENGIPYEEDLYLDVVLTPNGDIKLLDENELKEAYNRLEISKEIYDTAYSEANKLIKKLENNKNKLKEYTDKYLRQMEE